MQSYKALEATFLKAHHLSHLLALGHWDAQVLMRPKSGVARGQALAALEAHVHSLVTAPDVRARLAELTGESPATPAADGTAGSGGSGGAAPVVNLSKKQRANLREMRRKVEMEAALPEEFVRRRAQVHSQASGLWNQLRHRLQQQQQRGALGSGDGGMFAQFLPALREVVAVARQEGEMRRAALARLNPAKNASVTPYEALLDSFEPGMRAAQLDYFFGDIKIWLPRLLTEVVRKQESEAASVVPLATPFPVSAQQALCQHIMEHTLQFDFAAGRVDVSQHPFTGGCKEDCRVTLHFDPTNLERGLFAAIHETGHAKYEMNCGPREMLGQPVCNARSLGVHESQSLFLEKMIGRSPAFADFLSPQLETYFPAQPKAFSGPNLAKLFTRVRPGLSRVMADEVCYPMHVILRYEMERDLISGALEAEEVPKVWNAKMKEYLGVTVPPGRDDLGCLQDIHWAIGKFGYFPTYAVGSLLAAQLMVAIRKELGDDALEADVRRGELGAVFTKLHEKIWSNGCLYDTDELVRRATGELLNPRHFREHLLRRYLRS